MPCFVIKGQSKPLPQNKTGDILLPGFVIFADDILFVEPDQRWVKFTAVIGGASARLAIYVETAHIPAVTEALCKAALSESHTVVDIDEILRGCESNPQVGKMGKPSAVDSIVADFADRMREAHAAFRSDESVLSAKTAARPLSS